jgi:hypothetical protein
MKKPKLRPVTDWREIFPPHPAALLLPRPSDAELEKLGESIAEHGISVPLAFWEDADARKWTLDGVSRLDAAARKGVLFIDEHKFFHVKTLNGQIVRVPFEYYYEGTDPSPCDLVLRYNLERRHLTAEQRRDLIAQLLKADPEKSDRQIAALAQASHHTVGDVRTEMEGRGQIAHVETRTDKQNRRQPAKRSKSRKATVEKPTPPTASDPATDTAKPDPAPPIAPSPEQAEAPQADLTKLAKVVCDRGTEAESAAVRNGSMTLVAAAAQIEHRENHHISAATFAVMRNSIHQARDAYLVLLPYFDKQQQIEEMLALLGALDLTLADLDVTKTLKAGKTAPPAADPGDPAPDPRPRLASYVDAVTRYVMDASTSSMKHPTKQANKDIGTITKYAKCLGQFAQRSTSREALIAAWELVPAYAQMDLSRLAGEHGCFDHMREIGAWTEPDAPATKITKEPMWSEADAADAGSAPASGGRAAE